ncbi:MAG: hypothetical protein EOP52_11295 [Sphingobacteriales bacterium]|nr:MAG: hypothetical protein EOP52_11295 [Sphingobacteriales bacterium]
MHPQDLSGLRAFLPPNSFEQVAPYFRKHRIHLTITRARKTVLGNYRPGTGAHEITINGNLNPYSFLITLLHEIAHLLTFEVHGRRVAPHGAEWKHTFGTTLIPFLERAVFPTPVATALQQSLTHPAASTCSDPDLFRALWQYDQRAPDAVLVGDLPAGSQFRNTCGQSYQVLKHRRTRILCQQLGSGKKYLFPQVAEVVRLSGP